MIELKIKYYDLDRHEYEFSVCRCEYKSHVHLQRVLETDKVTIIFTVELSMHINDV